MNLKGGHVLPAVRCHDADPIFPGAFGGSSGGRFGFKRLLSITKAKRQIVESGQFEIREGGGGAAGVWFHGGNPVNERGEQVRADTKVYRRLMQSIFTEFHKNRSNP